MSSKASRKLNSGFFYEVLNMQEELNLCIFLGELGIICNDDFSTEFKKLSLSII